MPVRYDVSRPIRVSISIPAAPSVIPPTPRIRGPSDARSFVVETTALIMITTVMGKNASPVVTGE